MIAERAPSSENGSEEGLDERCYAVGGTFIDHLMRFRGDREDFAAGVAAHVIRRWPNPENRRWFTSLWGPPPK